MQKVENAIIMAAGISCRFVPLCYELPKGLLRVRGEILIERQIEQLKNAGIEDITVVVGYMKEKFYYLKEKYGVRIVANEDYNRYNNTSTLMRVLDRISSTYICSCDNYFAENVFKNEEEHAYYSAVYAEGPTNEWCLTLDGSERITDVAVRGKDAWYMLGHAYFSPEFSKKFKQILVEEYKSEEIRKSLWEEVYRRHVDELELYVRKYEAGSIFEFDSLEELRVFDKKYCVDSGSSVMNALKTILKCEEGEIRDLERMEGDLTDQSFAFSCRGERYVYRYSGEGTWELLARYPGREKRKNM